MLRSPSSTITVLLGAAVGAPLRYLIDRTLQSRRDTVFLWVPFTVNLTASAILGFLTGAASAAIVSPPTPNP